MIRRMRQLWTDRRGNAAIEFAILGPVMITLLMGVFQVGIGMQSYNALRSIAMDTARHAAVEYQQKKTMSNDQISTWARSRAINAPYLLNQAGISVTAVNAATQRVTGASERTLTLRYAVPSFLEVMGMHPYYISYTRPVFVPS